MGRRRRKGASSFAEKLAAAELELEQAETAIRYRKSQIAEAQDELEGLSGMAGWLPALLGQKAAIREELQQRIASLNSEVLAGRKRLIEARQARKSLEAKRAEGERAREQRDIELEHFAKRVQGSHHPLAERLGKLESDMATCAAEQEAQTAALKACLSLSASIAELSYLATRLKAGILYDVRGLDTAVDIASTKRARDRLQTVPQAVDAFNDACLPLGLAPINISFPKIDFSWSTLLIDDRIDSARTRHILDFSYGLEEVKDLVKETTLWVTKQRTACAQRYEELKQERRAMLDQALG